METKNINLNPYKIVWLEFRPIKGIVTKHDKKIMGVYSSFKDRFYKFSASKEKAMEFLNDNLMKIDFSKLDKPYECRIFTDKQYSNALESEDYKIHFTAKQESEMILINN